MTEQYPFPEDDRPDPFLFVEGHTHRPVTGRDLHNERVREASMAAEALREDDTLVVTYRDEEGNPQTYTFEVTETRWVSLGYGDTPSKQINGELKGIEVSGVDLTKARLSGSNRKLSNMQTPSLIITNSPLEFSAPSTSTNSYRRKRIGAPLTSDFAIQHTVDGAPTQVHPNRRGAEMYQEIPEHLASIDMAQQLVRRFGFASPEGTVFGEKGNPYESNGTLKQKQYYEDARYQVAYSEATGMGGNNNELRILDRERGTCLNVVYNTQKDILQVAVESGITEQDQDLKEGMGFRIGNGSVVTHTTSQRYGLDATVYETSDEVAAVLGMPVVDKEHAKLEAEIWPAGEAFRVQPIDSVITDLLKHEKSVNPIIGKHIRNLQASMRVEKGHDDGLVLHVGNETIGQQAIPIKDPATLLHSLTTELTSDRQQSHAEDSQMLQEAAGSTRSRVGDFLRRVLKNLRPGSK